MNILLIRSGPRRLLDALLSDNSLRSNVSLFQNANVDVLTQDEGFRSENPLIKNVYAYPEEKYSVSLIPKNLLSALRNNAYDTVAFIKNADAPLSDYLNVMTLAKSLRCRRVMFYDGKLKDVAGTKFLITIMSKTTEFSLICILALFSFLALLYLIPHGLFRKFKIKLSKGKFFSVLHGFVDINNQPNLICGFLRQKGIRAETMIFGRSPFGNRFDYEINADKKSAMARALVKTKLLLWICQKYDIVHYHFTDTLIENYVDLIYFKLAGVKTVWHFRGCDVRLFGLMKISPVHNCAKICRHRCPDVPKKRRIKAAQKWCSKIYVSTPDLLESVKDAEWVPNMTDSFEITPEINKDGTAIRICHAPTDRVIKGTEYVIKAVEELKKSYGVELVLVEKTSLPEAVKIYNTCDIGVDQLNVGWYGHYAVQLMQLGKPVLSYIRDDLLPFASLCPVVNVNADNLARKLEELLLDPKLRRQLGDEGIAYVNKIHNPETIGNKILNDYREILK